MLVWSGGREQHVCPFGRVEMMRSDDGGDTWSWPRTLLDSPIDDRDAGVLETSRGAILVTTFTSLAYEASLRSAVLKSGGAGAWPADRLERWQAAHRRVSESDRKAELGQWMIRSTDGGMTWSERFSPIVNSPHGPIQLSDGRLLYAGRELWTGEKRVGVSVSTDDGRHWNWLVALPVRAGDDPKDYHELHAVETGDDGQSLVVHIRNHNQKNNREILQCESNDGGRSWTTPHAIGVWGLPSFLTRLRDGRLLMTYGYRRQPFGNQARLSNDGGRTWSGAMTISGDGAGGDLGYPSTVQLGDGSLITVWYERMEGAGAAVLRQARWELPG